jgi:exosome complex RNA-binding protein Rrp42 (RNase PH superfamily)
VSEGRVLVTPEWDAEPEPLAIHHSPICVTFGLFPDGDGASTNGIKGVIDPSAEEEACMGGRITYCLTPHAELCTLHKVSGRSSCSLPAASLC